MTFQEIADREDNPAFILSEIGGIRRYLQLVKRQLA